MNIQTNKTVNIFKLLKNVSCITAWVTCCDKFTATILNPYTVINKLQNKNVKFYSTIVTPVPVDPRKLGSPNSPLLLIDLYKTQIPYSMVETGYMIIPSIALTVRNKKQIFSLIDCFHS